MRYRYIIRLIAVFTVFNFLVPVQGQWQPQTSGTTEFLLKAFFIDDNTGWVSGTNGTMLHTIDGGTTWLPQSTPTTIDLYGVFFLDALNGYTVGDGTVLHTTDGGTTWTSQTFASNQRGRDVWFVSPMVGFVAAGELGGPIATIYKTVDGGVTWTLNYTYSSGSVGTFHQLRFIDSLTGYAVGKNGTVFKTIDGGTIWNAGASGVSPNILSFDFHASGEAVAVGDNGTVISTSDDFSTWSPISSTMADRIGHIDFWGSLTGFAVGGDISGNTGYIYRTVDAGQTWTTDYSTSQRMYGLYCPSGGTAYAVGNGGTILKLSEEPSSVEETELLAELGVYPNPVDENLYINIGQQKGITYQLFDMSGKLIQSGLTTSRISLVNLSQGAYILKAEGFKPVRVIKQ